MSVASTAPKSNGLKNLVDTIIAPKEAFESLRVLPTWGWALAIAIALSAIGNFLMVPAIQHAMAAGWPEMVAKTPALARLTPEQLAMQLAISQKFVAFGWIASIFVVPLYCLIEAVVMLIFNKLGRGSGTFVQYFAASCNIAVPAAGIASIVLAAIVLARGTAGFSSPQSIQSAMPNLGMFAAISNVKLAAFLATITPFTIWATGLSISAMLIIGRVPKLQAWLAGIVLFLIPALIATAAAK